MKSYDAEGQVVTRRSSFLLYLERLGTIMQESVDGKVNRFQAKRFFKEQETILLSRHRSLVRFPFQ